MLDIYGEEVPFYKNMVNARNSSVKAHLIDHGR